MIRLKNHHQDKKALIFFGGPSVIENNIPFEKINRDRYVIFLEAKALTPYFLTKGIVPDYYLMFYPEKCKSNAFQHVVFQSFLAGIALSGLIRDEYLSEYDYIRTHFAEFFEDFRPHKGPHKKYRYKRDVYFKNSPFDLLGNLKSTKILTFIRPFQDNLTKFNYANGVYSFDMVDGKNTFDIEDYYHPCEEEGTVKVKNYTFFNSAAAALFPSLKYMGFKEVYFLGMDMSMLGSMEYSSYYTFKSMRHFAQFFKGARRVFNAAFRPNRRRFMRPPYEFKDLARILSYKEMSFTNIHEPFTYALPLKGVKNISFKEFLHGR